MKKKRKTRSWGGRKDPSIRHFGTTGKITVEIVTDVQGETLLKLPIKKVKREISSTEINSVVIMALSPMDSNTGELTRERDSRMRSIYQRN